MTRAQNVPLHLRRCVVGLMYWPRPRRKHHECLKAPLVSIQVAQESARTLAHTSKQHTQSPTELKPHTTSQVNTVLYCKEMQIYFTVH